MKHGRDAGVRTEETLAGVEVEAHPESRVDNSQPHGIGRVVALDGLWAWNNLGRNVVFAGDDFRPARCSTSPSSPTTSHRSTTSTSTRSSTSRAQASS